MRPDLQPVSLSEEAALLEAIENSLRDQPEEGPRLITDRRPLNNTLVSSVSSSANVADAPSRCKFFYVIFACKKDPELVGIHHCQWSELQKQLPGQKLFGSGAVDCKRFDTLEEAKVYFAQKSKAKCEPTLHEQ